MSLPGAAGLLLSLAIIVAAARALGYAANRIGQPAVVGEITAGILLGPTVLAPEVSHWLFSSATRQSLNGLADLGLALFMFITGYELDHAIARGMRRAATTISLGATALPFGLGVAIAFWLAPRHHVGHVVPFVLFMGAAMSVTAFPVLARILSDRGMQRTGIGILALSSAAIADVGAWCVLALVTALSGISGHSSWHAWLVLPYIVVLWVGVRPLLRRLLELAARRGAKGGLVVMTVAGLLLSSTFTEAIGIHFIFGAFAFGVVMPRGSSTNEMLRPVLDGLGQVGTVLLLPVYFVVAGFNINLSRIGVSGLAELGVIMLVAMAGKAFGTAAAARLLRRPPRESVALAALMNTRGLTEIVILMVGLQAGILDTRLFSLMVLMAVVTTAAAAPVLRISGHGGSNGGPLRVLPSATLSEQDEQVAALSGELSPIARETAPPANHLAGGTVLD
jgi:Kef-type K+ transport system membrane component KefB